jgi:hypothetical protein
MPRSILVEMLPRLSKSSASSAEKFGGSEASLKIEFARLRMDGDNNAVDSRSLGFPLARDLVSGSDGVGTTDASLKSLSCCQSGRFVGTMSSSMTPLVSG